MKYLHLLLLSILCSCNGKPKINVEKNPFYKEEVPSFFDRLIGAETETIYIPYQYDLEDSIDVRLEEYTVNERLFPLLDSIIHSMETCSRFTPAKAGFYLTHKYSKGYPLVVLGTIESQFSHNTAEDNAIFFYKSYNFFYEGNIIDSFFKRTGKYLQYRGVKTDKYMSDLYAPGLYWRYILRNNRRLEIIDYSNCDSGWLNEKYIGVH